MTVEEVGRVLGVSGNTVKTQLKGIYRKLGVHSRAGVIMVARNRGLL
jgi:LuxR family maltose regulon positive regulatory protein